MIWKRKIRKEIKKGITDWKNSSTYGKIGERKKMLKIRIIASRGEKRTKIKRKREWKYDTMKKVGISEKMVRYPNVMKYGRSKRGER